MKILQIIDVLAPVGGAQRSVRDAIEPLQGAGHEVLVVHQDLARETEHIPSARYSDDPDVLDQIREFAPDIVHVHGSSLPAELAKAIAARPVVYSLHNFAFACSTGSKYFRDGTVCVRAHGPGCLVEGPVRGCLHRVDARPALARYRRIHVELPRLREAAAIVAYSHFVRDVALRNGLPAERINVVPYCAEAGASLAAAGERTVTFAGRIVRDKGLDLLIDALALRSDTWDRLLVAGDGWDRGRCERLVRGRRIAHRVDFLGHLDFEGVRETLARSRVVVVPSRWPEPFGIVGLEAMAVGRPVVASAVGGIPEWLDDGRTGILVPPGDPESLGEAIGSLLSDPARAAELGAEGRRQVERFSPRVHVEALLAVYERALFVAGRGSAARAA